MRNTIIAILTLVSFSVVAEIKCNFRFSIGEADVVTHGLNKIILRKEHKSDLLSCYACKEYIKKPENQKFLIGKEARYTFSNKLYKTITESNIDLIEYTIGIDKGNTWPTYCSPLDDDFSLLKFNEKRIKEEKIKANDSKLSDFVDEYCKYSMKTSLILDSQESYNKCFNNKYNSYEMKSSSYKCKIVTHEENEEFKHSLIVNNRAFTSEHPYFIEISMNECGDQIKDRCMRVDEYKRVYFTGRADSDDPLIGYRDPARAALNFLIDKGACK